MHHKDRLQAQTPMFAQTLRCLASARANGDGGLRGGSGCAGRGGRQTVTNRTGGGGGGAGSCTAPPIEKSQLTGWSVSGPAAGPIRGADKTMSTSSCRKPIR